MLYSWRVKLALYYQIWRSKNSVVNTYLQSLIPLLNLTIKEAPLLALDLEMTGLDAKKDQIISIGIIPIIDGQIEISKGKHKLIKIEGSVGQSAAIHGLLDNHLEQAVSLKEAIKWLLEEARDHILVAHHAPLDLSFIEQAVMKQTNAKCKLFAIDTLRIEHQRLLRKQPMIKEGELRLGNCRKRYNLPNYDAHNALIDALSCAELLLAQTSKMGGLAEVKVSELIC